MSVSADTAVATVRGFIDRINAHDASGITALCTPDHVLIDSLGARLSGLDQLEQAWQGYFALFADYRIEADATAAAPNKVLTCGWASAVHRGSGSKWRIPAAWRAVVAGDRIAEWQVYADNGPVREILGCGPQ